MDELSFLDNVNRYVQSQSACNENKMGRIDYDFNLGTFPQQLPRIIFDGESAPSEKGYEVLAPYVPMPGDRVVLLRVKDTYVIAGAVQTSRQSWSSGAVSDYIDGNVTTNRTTFGDITDAYGPEVSLYTGTKALVIIQAVIQGTYTRFPYMSFSVNNSFTEDEMFKYSTTFESQHAYADSSHTLNGVFVVDHLTPGYNTFTAKYRVNADDAGYNRRFIAVVPL